MKTTVLLIIPWLLAVGCQSNNNEQGVEPEPVIVFTPGLQDVRSINILGEARNYYLYLPQNPATASIIVLLHGNRGSSEQLLGLNGLIAPNKVWMDIALRENLVLIVPNGAVGPEGHQGWNDCRTDAVGNPDTDDVLFINTLINDVSTEFRSTKTKVYAVGISNGGLMTMRLADEMSDKLQAFAAVVSSRPVNTECIDPAVPLSALFMNGTDDPILPYDGGPIRPNRGDFYSTIDTVAYWVNRNQTNTTVEVAELTNSSTQDNSSVRVFSYNDGLNATRVVHYEVNGGGHTEPSIQEQYNPLYKRIVGEQNNDIESAEEIWTFFNSSRGGL